MADFCRGISSLITVYFRVAPSVASGSLRESRGWIFLVGPERESRLGSSSVDEAKSCSVLVSFFLYKRDVRIALNVVSTKYYSDLESAASDCHCRPRGSRDTRRHRLAQVSEREKFAY